MKTWILVADASRARIFETDGAKEGLREIHSLLQPASRMKTSELVGDRQGRVSKGRGPSAMGVRTGGHEMQANRFAMTLARTLDHASERREFGPLVIVAPSQFMGRIRAVVSDRVLDAITEMVDKDFTQAPTEELAAKLDQLLPAAAYAW